MNIINLEVDDRARALYITLSVNEIVKTVETLKDRIFVDLDANGDPVGIEILEVVSHRLPDLLREIESLLDDTSRSIGRELAIA